MSEEFKCASCEKAIDGRALMVGGGYFCPTCFVLVGTMESFTLQCDSPTLKNASSVCSIMSISINTVPILRWSATVFRLSHFFGDVFRL